MRNRNISFTFIITVYRMHIDQIYEYIWTHAHVNVWRPSFRIICFIFWHLTRYNCSYTHPAVPTKRHFLSFSIARYSIEEDLIHALLRVQIFIQVGDNDFLTRCVDCQSTTTTFFSIKSWKFYVSPPNWGKGYLRFSLLSWDSDVKYKAI